MPLIWVALILAFVSALVTNTAYSLEHDAAAALPPLSPRRPFRSVQMLLGDRRWLVAFGAETAGWALACGRPDGDYGSRDGGHGAGGRGRAQATGFHPAARCPPAST